MLDWHCSHGQHCKVLFLVRQIIQLQHLAGWPPGLHNKWNLKNPKNNHHRKTSQSQNIRGGHYDMFPTLLNTKNTVWCTQNGFPSYPLNWYYIPHPYTTHLCTRLTGVLKNWSLTNNDLQFLARQPKIKDLLSWSGKEEVPLEEEEPQCQESGEHRGCTGGTIPTEKQPPSLSMS